MLTSVEVPLPPEGFISEFFKFGTRPALDISTIAIGLGAVRKGDRLNDVRVGFGAVAPTPIRAPETEAALEGKPLDEAIDAALAAAEAEIKPISDFRASAWYRRELVHNVLRRMLKMSANIDIGFKLNGVNLSAKVSAGMSALDAAARRAALTGTKYGCGEGECGACTILVDGLPSNSCLMFAVDCDGPRDCHHRGPRRDPRAEALQTSFVEHGAVQCGFCTPGMVMQARQLLEEDRAPDAEQIQRGIEGNLCRCTGYKKIVEAIAAAAGTPSS